MAHFRPLPLLAATLLCALAARAETTPEGDTAWKPLKSASAAPNLPPEWETAPPKDPAVLRNTLRAETERLLAVAEQAREFALNFPEDDRREAAWKLATQALSSAQKIGSTTARGLLGKLDQERLADTKTSVEQRFDIRLRQVQADAQALLSSNPDGARDTFESGVRSLLKEFPGRPEPWALLLEIVDQGNDPATRAKLQEIADGPAAAVFKARAAAVLHRYDQLGKPLELKFTASDGRAVDLASLRGKVVVIHFWATWCDTCAEAIETMSKAYATLRDLGVELIGVTIDTDKTKVEQFIKNKKVLWPQFWNPAGPNNRIVREWGMTAVPAMWLVDRHGVLRDLNAQAEMSKKIEGLLAEPASAPK